MTCQSCQHYHPNQIDPMNLSAEPGGECRACPPNMISFVTQQGLVSRTAYPHVPANWPTCGMFELKVLEG